MRYTLAQVWDQSHVLLGIHLCVRIWRFEQTSQPMASAIWLLMRRRVRTSDQRGRGLNLRSAEGFRCNQLAQLADRWRPKCGLKLQRSSCEEISEGSSKTVSRVSPGQTVPSSQGGFDAYMLRPILGMITSIIETPFEAYGKYLICQSSGEGFRGASGARCSHHLTPSDRYQRKTLLVPSVSVAREPRKTSLFGDLKQRAIATPRHFWEVHLVGIRRDHSIFAGQAGANQVGIFIRPLRQVSGKQRRFFIV